MKREQNAAWGVYSHKQGFLKGLGSPKYICSMYSQHYHFGSIKKPSPFLHFPASFGNVWKFDLINPHVNMKYFGHFRYLLASCMIPMSCSGLNQSTSSTYHLIFNFIKKWQRFTSLYVNGCLLDCHHAWRSLDPTLDISSTFVKTFWLIFYLSLLFI